MRYTQKFQNREILEENVLNTLENNRAIQNDIRFISGIAKHAWIYFLLSWKLELTKSTFLINLNNAKNVH